MATNALAMRTAPRARRWPGAAARLALVVAAHAAVVLALIELHPQLRKPAEPLFIELITPPQPKVEPRPQAKPDPAPPPPARKPQPAVKSAPRPAPEPVPAPPREAPIVLEPAPVIEPQAPAAAAPAAPKPEGGADRAAIGAGTGGAGKSAAVPIAAPRFDAAYLNNPRPEYPRIARRLGEQGKVLLHVFVNAAGHPEKVEIRSSSGHARLDQAALEAVRKWRFVPARRGDEPIGAWVLVPISFVLES